MKILSLVSLLGIFIISCKNNNKDTVTGCYRYATPTDTIFLQLKGDEHKLTGNLTYALHEKDRNTGTVEGEMKKDIIHVIYTFSSEGVISKREVVWKKMNDTLQEGYGLMTDKEGTLIFNNPSSLQFDSSFALKKINCP